MGEKLVFARRPKSEPEPESDESWRILVVDDDPEVHAVTRLALRSLRYSGRRAEILSAHSAAEARRVLAQGRPVAVILLDVVMETDDAGLQLVRHIRDKMKNAAVRIILRTGQPGQAPEEHVIVEYDINDYKAKTELTAQKLFTSVITALRAFRDITMLEAHQQGLRQVIECSDSLLKMRSL
ncbi:MAG: response regulator, partial [Rhodospirillales bacterium]|nr:response regulator [Rhodospirillales bacterium]